MPAARDHGLALVLSGGGARGAFDAGVVEAVDRAGLRPRVISGTSAGAITGAAVACGWSPGRIPGLFQPVEIDGTDDWDGGLVSNTPLTAALAHDAERLLVAGASTAEPGPTPPASLGDVLALALDHVLREALLTDVDHARTVSVLAEEAPGQTHHQPIEMVTVLPEEPIAGLGDLLDFEPEVAHGLIDSGRRVTTTCLEDAGWA